MNCFFEDDVIVLKTSDDLPGSIPLKELSDIDIQTLAERYRIAEGKCVDVSDYDEFYIDNAGQKHIISNQNWQKLSCQWDDILILEQGLWRVESQLERDKKQAKQNALHFISGMLSRFTADTLPEEVASWPQKAAAARAFIAGNQTAEQEAVILSESRIFGGDDAVTGMALSQKIAAKASVYERIIAATSGMKKMLFTGIESASSAEEIDQLMASTKQQAEAMLNDILTGGA